MRFLVLFLVLAAFAGIESVTAQEPVDGCARQCEPTAPDVNPDFPVSDGPVNVILYGHMQHSIGWGTLNLMPPNPEYEQDLDAGTMMPTVATQTGACISSGYCPDAQFQNGVFRMHFCPGAIQFTSADEWFMGCHASKTTLPLEVTAPPIAYFYLSADAAPSSSAGSGGVDAGTLPNVRVRAALVKWVDETRETLAEGWSEPGILMSVPGREQVYEFQTTLLSLSPDGRLELGKDSLAAERLELEIEIEQISVDDPAVRVAQRDWRIHTGAGFPPRLILQVADPILRHALTTTTYKGVSYVRYSVQSGFGSYEFDPSRVEAKIVDANNVSAPGAALEFLLMKRSFAHDGMHRPVNFTWQVHVEHLHLDASDYRVEVSATNLQQTFRVTDAVALEIHDFDGTAAVPGPSWMVAILVGLGVVVGLRRRGQ